MSRKRSEEFFHQPPHNYGCSQAVILGFENEFGTTAEDVTLAGEWRGGRAPEGICGALYAANYLLAKRGLAPITDEFSAVAGSPHCRGIKGPEGTHYPCLECVKLADQLVEERLK